ncbi:MAG: hypothetical protein EBS90_09310 [Betaproteobacteria bacterium]|nr:hypothetical protein [Betaproteobacteria bacterium]
MAETLEVISGGQAKLLVPPDPGTANFTQVAGGGGYEFQTTDGKLQLRGEGMTFFVKAKLGGNFTLKARLALPPGEGPRPAVVFNGVNSLIFEAEKARVEGVNLFFPILASQVPWDPRLASAVAAGREFELEIQRTSNAPGKGSLRIALDGKVLLEIPEKVGTIESLALRPGHSGMAH